MGIIEIQEELNNVLMRDHRPRDDEEEEDGGGREEIEILRSRVQKLQEELMTSEEENQDKSSKLESDSEKLQQLEEKMNKFLSDKNDEYKTVVEESEEIKEKNRKLSQELFEINEEISIQQSNEDIETKENEIAQQNETIGSLRAAEAALVVKLEELEEKLKKENEVGREIEAKKENSQPPNGSPSAKL